MSYQRIKLAVVMVTAQIHVGLSWPASLSAIKTGVERLIVMTGIIWIQSQPTLFLSCVHFS